MLPLQLLLCELWLGLEGIEQNKRKTEKCKKKIRQKKDSFEEENVENSIEYGKSAYLCVNYLIESYAEKPRYRLCGLLAQTS
jgi:hypothetical protein